MQINSTSQNTSLDTQAIASKQAAQNTTQSKTGSNLIATSQSSNSDNVTISIQATELSSKAQSNSKEADTLPAKPALPNEGEKVENYVEYRKAKAQYQIYSDMAGIATGNSKGMSASTAYYLSNNDEARAAVVDSKAQQQQVSAMQSYAKTTQDIDGWY